MKYSLNNYFNYVYYFNNALRILYGLPEKRGDRGCDGKSSGVRKDRLSGRATGGHAFLHGFHRPDNRNAVSGLYGDGSLRRFDLFH